VLSQIGVYAMSKAAVIHMTRAMALEWGRYGINVNAICPGYIDTEINHLQWSTEQGRKLVEHAADEARRPAARPRRVADDAVREREPLHQRRGDHRRRRLLAVAAALRRDAAAVVAGARVLGVLVEKSLTVPDSYPLSLNSLTLGCNQKTARDPVIAASEGDVQVAVDALKALSLAFESSGSRVARYEHNVGRALGVPSQSVALLATLVLRGPQTPAELRTAAERLHRFAGRVGGRRLSRRACRATGGEGRSARRQVAARAGRTRAALGASALRPDRPHGATRRGGRRIDRRDERARRAESTPRRGRERGRAARRARRAALPRARRPTLIEARPAMRFDLPEAKKLTLEMVIPIRWGDMDAMGHVNNTIYFRYLESFASSGCTRLSVRPIRRARGR
jgi:uncharacterized protein YceH (UPF0502 family)